MSHRNFLLLFGAIALSYVCYVRAEQNPYARYIADGFALIDRWALQDPPDQELFDAAMNSMVAVLHRYGDTHSEFIDAARQQAYRDEFRQEFGGVGIRLRMLGDPPLPTVIGLPEPGSATLDPEIHLADRIIAVDGRSTAGLQLDEVTSMVRGPVGEPVTLTLKSPDEDRTQDVTLERAAITVESVLGDIRDPAGHWRFTLSDHPQIGYLRIIMFGDKTAAEVAKILADLTAAGVEAIIIDVRDDAGGTLDAAVDVADMFLPAGRSIVTTRGREKTIRDRYVSTGGAYQDLPLAVLVDRNSASASEILAASLQDYQRAAIVGERSYGKGTVQRLVRLESGRSVLKLTSATYWRPSGKNIHRMPGDPLDAEWGVTPDEGLGVEQSADEYRLWREYRVRRDLLGEDVTSVLAAELDLADGKISADYRDPVVKHAVDYLLRTIGPSAETAPQPAPGDADVNL